MPNAFTGHGGTAFVTDFDFDFNELGKISEEHVKRYGDPYDKSDPRNAAPSDRSKKFPKLTVQERVHLLELDMEIVMSNVAYMKAESIKGKLKEFLATVEEPKPGGYL